MIEFQSHFRYVFGHGDVYVPVTIIPFDEQTTVIFPFPVDCHLEFFFESIKEMGGVAEGKIFYPEIIDAEAEACFSRGVLP